MLLYCTQSLSTELIVIFSHNPIAPQLLKPQIVPGLSELLRRVVALPPDEKGFRTLIMQHTFEILACIEGWHLRPQSDALLDENIDRIAIDTLSQGIQDLPLPVVRNILTCLYAMSRHLHPPPRLVEAIDCIVDVIVLDDVQCLHLVFAFLQCLIPLPTATNRMVLRPTLFKAAVDWLLENNRSEALSATFVEHITLVSPEAAILLVQNGLIPVIRPLTRHPWPKVAEYYLYLFGCICPVPEIAKQILDCNIIEESIEALNTPLKWTIVVDAHIVILLEALKLELLLDYAVKLPKFIQAFKILLNNTVDSQVTASVLRYGSTLGALGSADPPETGVITNPFFDYLCNAFRSEGKEDKVTMLEEALTLSAP